jgi:hypothetical protein
MGANKTGRALVGKTIWIRNDRNPRGVERLADRTVPILITDHSRGVYQGTAPDGTTILLSLWDMSTLPVDQQPEPRR